MKQSISDKWYCFACREWHDKDTTCIVNDDHYGIWDYNSFWEFIKKHRDELKKALGVGDEIYVIVYVGYEGIEEVVYATADRDDAIRKIRELRRKAKKDPDRDPDRYCVMKQGKDKFECACAELGVEPSKPIFY